MKPNFDYFLVFVCCCLVVSQNHVNCSLLSSPRPDPDENAAFARWLVSESTWGVLNTISNELGMEGPPFGNVVSFSDGLPHEGRGVPYFYLTTLDPTARNAYKDPRASFTLSEYPIGTCGNLDPQNYTCAKITLTGKLKVLYGNPTEDKFARISLFTKHPDMKGWPEDHSFQFFKLNIETIFLVNMFGSPKPVTVAQYLNAKI